MWQTFFAHAYVCIKTRNFGKKIEQYKPAAAASSKAASSSEPNPVSRPATAGVKRVPAKNRPALRATLISAVEVEHLYQRAVVLQKCWLLRDRWKNRRIS